jgi:hypothetical protein
MMRNYQRVLIASEEKIAQPFGEKAVLQIAA